MVLICYSLWEKWMYNEDMKISKIVVLLFYAENTEKAISRSFNINSMRPGYAFIIFIVQLSSSKWGRNSQNHFVLNVIKLLHFKTLSTIAFLKKQFKYIQRKTRMNAQLVWAYTITYNAMSLVPWAIKWWGRSIVSSRNGTIRPRPRPPSRHQAGTRTNCWAKILPSTIHYPPGGYIEHSLTGPHSTS